MGSMLDIMKDFKSFGSMRQDSKELKADVSKLIHIVEMLIDICGEFIVEVRVSPMNIVQLPMEDIKSLQFFIRYDSEYCTDSSIQECKDIVMELIKSEFSGIDEYLPTVFSLYSDWNVSSLLLYNREGIKGLDELSDSQLMFIYSLMDYTGAKAIEIPTNYLITKHADIFIHGADFSDISNIKDKIAEFGKVMKIKFKEFDIKDKKSVDYNVVYMTGLSPLQYNVPYIYIDTQSIDSQRISEVLKGY